MQVIVLFVYAFDLLAHLYLYVPFTGFYFSIPITTVETMTSYL